MFSKNYKSFVKLLNICECAVIFMLSVITMTECQDFFGGFYSYYPEYGHDIPAPDHYSGPIPLGLPMGGFSANGRGPAFGLQAYVVRQLIPMPVVQSYSVKPQTKFPTPLEYIKEFKAFFKVFKNIWELKR